MEKQQLIEVFKKYEPRTPMSPDETKICIDLLLNNNEPLKIDINNIDKHSKEYKTFNPLINSLESRTFLKYIEKLAGMKINLGAFILIVQHIVGRQRAAIIYANYLYSKLPESAFVDLDIVTTSLFPWGFFSEEQIENIWHEIQNEIEIGIIP